MAAAPQDIGDGVVVRADDPLVSGQFAELNGVVAVPVQQFGVGGDDEDGRVSSRCVTSKASCSTRFHW